MPPARLVLVVDGGGTTTTACVASRQESGDALPLGEATAGQSNPAVVGLEPCQTHILEACQAALAAAKLADGALLDRLVIGLAGIEATGYRAELRGWAAQQLDARRVDVVTDIDLLLLAATGERATVGLISGTGSVAVGRTSSGRTARSGGRGFLTGDAGSGFWIGQQGVTAGLRALDAMGPETLLVDFLADRVGSREAAEWTNTIYASDQDARNVVASFAPLVLEAAEQQDQVALDIVERAGIELAQLVLGVARQLTLSDRDFDLVVAGGVLVHQPSIRAAVAAQLDKAATRPFHELVVAEPASAVAQRLCRDQ